ncbi:MAG: tetratricopeptide repeat protein [Ferruginibacter sp.]
MKKQIIAASAGIALVAILFFVGKTSLPKKPVTQTDTNTSQLFDIQHYIKESKAKASPSQSEILAKMENGISRGNVKEQQINAYEQLANFYKDSLKLFDPYAFYISEAAKLDNSEKKLTFAAHLFLDNLRREHDDARLGWQTSQAVDLFKKALALDPENTDLKIGLGSSYIYGKQTGDVQQTMLGIQELLSVVRKDSNNMKAQFVLGVGGAVSGQYDKAIERFKKVMQAEPNNAEAAAFLGDTYAATGNKAEAVKWYNVSKRLVNNPAYSKEVDERIKSLK